MKTFVRVTLTAVAAVSIMVASSVVYASGGSCRPRDLTAAEQQAGERVLARLRPLLPPAPLGWQVDGADKTEIVSGSCIDANTHKSVPQPVSVKVHRTFVRDAPPTVVPAPIAGSAPKRAEPDPQVQARIKTLEEQIDELKRRDQAATTAYQAARAKGDGPGQRAASEQSRAARQAMNAPMKELMELRQAERQQRQAGNAAQHDFAVAQREASLANRRVAKVVITTNSGRAIARASRVVSIAGASLAISQAGFSTSLLFGDGWTHDSGGAFRSWAAGAPTSRVQDVNVRVEGNDEVSAALIQRLDMKAINGIVER